MATSKITVYRNNRPAGGVRVSLEFTGLTQMGFTKTFTTNSDGVTYVEHSSTGEAMIYIDGSSHHKIRTPGEEVIYL